MPTFIIPVYLEEYTGHTPLIETRTDNLNDAFTQLFAQYPDLKPQIFSAEGGVRPHIMVFVGKYHINALDGLKTSLQKDDQISILVNFAGG